MNYFTTYLTRTQSNCKRYRMQRASWYYGKDIMTVQ